MKQLEVELWQLWCWYHFRSPRGFYQWNWIHLALLWTVCTTTKNGEVKGSAQMRSTPASDAWRSHGFWTSCRKHCYSIWFKLNDSSQPTTQVMLSQTGLPRSCSCFSRIFSGRFHIHTFVCTVKGLGCVNLVPHGPNVGTLRPPLSSMASG